MKKLICLILTICFLLPVSTACVTGLQGNVTITINYLDGTKKTISGHRKFDKTGDSESIYTKMSQSLRYTTNEVGKVIVYKYANDFAFDREQVYQFENGKRVEIFQKLVNKTYQVRFVAICPITKESKTLTKFYKFGDTMELTSDVQNLLSYENPPTNFDRYTFEKWRIAKYEDREMVFSREFNFNNVFNEEYDALFEEVKSKNQYGEYVMEISAVYKPNTYNVVLHFEHEGVKNLKTSVSPVTIEVPFYATNFGLSEFKTYVKEENIEFEYFSTDMNNKVLLPSELSKEVDGTTINLYAHWERYKPLKIDFLNGKGVQTVRVYEDKYSNYFKVDVGKLNANLTSGQLETLIGFGEDKDKLSVVTDLYLYGNSNVTYYPIFA